MPCERTECSALKLFSILSAAQGRYHGPVVQTLEHPSDLLPVEDVITYCWKLQSRTHARLDGTVAHRKTIQSQPAA